MYARGRGDSIRASVRSASGCRSSRHVRAMVRRLPEVARASSRAASAARRDAAWLGLGLGLGS
eukprot:scaffold90526_cov72-Phaeocystis_antarctica.AAC.1